MGSYTTSLQLLADMGIPMIAFTLPAMLLLLLPVIAVEGLCYKKWLELPMREAMKASALSNCISTVAGIPLAWCAMLALQFGAFSVITAIPGTEKWDSPIANAVAFVLSSAWIEPPESAPFPWIAGATLVLLVPFYFASYFIEYRAIKRMATNPGSGLGNLEQARVRRSVRNSNLLTYGGMFAGTTLWLVLSLRRG